MTTQSTGQLGETIAATFLSKLGFKILERNYHSSRWGEIDIVAVDGDQLVFVEVKTRVGDQQTSAIEAITPHKLQTLKRAAYYYQLENEDLPEALRIDVVTVEFENVLQNPVVEHYRNVMWE